MQPLVLYLASLARMNVTPTLGTQAAEVAESANGSLPMRRGDLSCLTLEYEEDNVMKKMTKTSKISSLPPLRLPWVWLKQSDGSYRKGRIYY